jgi:hypothetical protein
MRSPLPHSGTQNILVPCMTHSTLTSFDNVPLVRLNYHEFGRPLPCPFIILLKHVDKMDLPVS